MEGVGPRGVFSMVTKICLNTSQDKALEWVMNFYDGADRPYVPFCNKCGAVVVDVERFVGAVVGYWDCVVDSCGQEEAEETGATLKSLMDLMVEVAPKSDDEFEVWRATGPHKLLPDLVEHYHDFVYLKAEKAALKADSNCRCFSLNALS